MIIAPALLTGHLNFNERLVAMVTPPRIIRRLTRPAHPNVEDDRKLLDVERPTAGRFGPLIAAPSRMLEMR